MLRSILSKAQTQYSLLTSSRTRVLKTTVKLIHQTCRLSTVMDNVQSQATSTIEESDVDKETAFDPKSIFPNKDTASLVINGVKYDEVPIIYIKATGNNTLLSAAEYTGKVFLSESGGTVGFKNAKKGTNIAAQAAALSLSEKMVKIGVNTVRVSVRGIGPGRMSAIKGLQMGGLTVISITDTTRIPFNGNRPRKPRRL